MASSEAPRGGGAAACYVWPASWIGALPAHLDVSFGPGEEPPRPDLGELEDVIRDVAVGHGLRVRVHRDGMFVFDFATWAPLPLVVSDFFELREVVLRRVTLMNGFLACLCTMVARRQGFAMAPSALTPGSIFTMNSFNNPTGVKMPEDERAKYYESARYPGSYGGRLPMQLDSRLIRIMLIEEATIDETVELFGGLVDHPSSTKVLALAELLVRSASALSDHDDSQSLILSWAIIEASIGRLWRTFYLEDPEARAAGSEDPFMPRRREQNLDRLNVSTVTEMLSLVGRIPFPLYLRLREPRDARNKWIHQLAPVSADTAGNALAVAQDMLELTEGVSLAIPIVLQL
jgi:hypothetical protein